MVGEGLNHRLEMIDGVGDRWPRSGRPRVRPVGSRAGGSEASRVRTWGVTERVRSRAGRIEGPLDRMPAPLVAVAWRVVVLRGST